MSSYKVTPGFDEFSKNNYLSANAFTTENVTDYYYKITNKHLNQLIGYVSGAMNNPVVTDDFLVKEMNNVKSENV